MIYNAFPSTTGEVEEGSINGTAEVPFKEIVLKGNTSQESTTGKNLWGGFTYSRTNNGVAFTHNIDGSITASNTASNFATSIGVATISLNNWFKTLTPGTYTLSGGINNNIGLQLLNENNTLLASSYTTSETFTISENTNVYIRAVVNNGATVNNILYVQLESGSSATAYEPYTGGNPAPNPDFPMPVNVVTGDNEVKVEGKNLVPNNLASGSSSGITYTVNSDGSIKLSGTATARVEPYLYTNNNPITFKAGTYRNTSNRMIILYANGYNIIYANSTVTFTEDKQVTSAYFRIENGETVNETYYPQIILNSITDTSYEPYQSQTYPINLGSMELCKIGDYQDYLYKENGIWYKYGAVGKLDLDGSENWTYNTQYNFFALNITSIVNDKVYSNYYLYYPNYASVQGSYGCWTVQNSFRIKNTDYTTVEGFKAWLSTHNTTIYYVLATPTITEITDTTLIEQLDNLEKAYSYDTQTNISQTNQDKPFIISYEAILSLRNVLNS